MPTVLISAGQGNVFYSALTSAPSYGYRGSGQQGFSQRLATQGKMARMGPPDKEAVVEFAKRETSPEHYRDFEPITRGPVFAILMLIPLGLLAGVFLLAGKAAAFLEKQAKWR